LRSRTATASRTGNGGNIAIDPQLVILDHSSIIAQAVEGHGGNITITADQFIPSSDSLVSASSQLGISGTVVINGPRVDVNGALVVLSTQLRGRTEVLREACESRTGRPLSSLVEAGRGGLPHDPESHPPRPLYRRPRPRPQPAHPCRYRRIKRRPPPYHRASDDAVQLNRSIAKWVPASAIKA
jgi:hypothetical protein